MPELPDLEAYRTALAARIGGRPIDRVAITHPFVLRTATPPVTDIERRRVDSVRRIGKRIVLALDGALFVVVHLMIAGRLRWLAPGAKPPVRITLATFDFEGGRLALTEAGTRRRASIHVIAGESALAAIDPGGVEPLACDAATYAAVLRRGNHTLKRALTDPRAFAGIGNAYSDEVLHQARLSPLALTANLRDDDIARLHAATVDVLGRWTRKLVGEAAIAFPEKVTAFRPEMAVHGRHGLPCPDCGAPVQRIVYAENECNYCARCQTGGRVLADRALSRLLRSSYPRTLDDIG
ncbi:MAG: hypothetical protein J0L91_07360 [Burkholderiales bacterium]|nr:hypothetical protein [Burkholderiales bacterium]MCC7113525.1 hypothetical protein [Burkholderiales bacterium]